jgi:hypothetical protein
LTSLAIKQKGRTVAFPTGACALRTLLSAKVMSQIPYNKSKPCAVLDGSTWMVGEVTSPMGTVAYNVDLVCLDAGGCGFYNHTAMFDGDDGAVFNVSEYQVCFEVPTGPKNKHLFAGRMREIIVAYTDHYPLRPGCVRRTAQSSAPKDGRFWSVWISHYSSASAPLRVTGRGTYLIMDEDVAESRIGALI